MMYKGMLAALAAWWGLAFTGLPVTVAGDLGMSEAYADGGRRAKGRARAKRTIRVRGSVRRIGFYSYTDRDVINTLLWPPFRFSSVSPLFDPSQRQSAAGPFDSGFFFDSGIGPPWNNAPYPR